MICLDSAKFTNIYSQNQPKVETCTLHIPTLNLNSFSTQMDPNRNNPRPWLFSRGGNALCSGCATHQNEVMLLMCGMFVNLSFDLRVQKLGENLMASVD